MEICSKNHPEPSASPVEAQQCLLTLIRYGRSGPTKTTTVRSQSIIKKGSNVHKDNLSVRCKVLNVFICLASELAAGGPSAPSVFNHLRLEKQGG